ncbi:hypothetical protein JW707_04995 [Candidatus Woesearchaeota archaeon]|nr:hypothetical protein [Candidatus Woesearchaeota archaeon]
MKKALVISILVLMIAFSGCREGLGGRKEPVAGYRTGSQGLVINFMPNYPRTQMYDDEPFDVIIELRNKGSYATGFGGDRIYLSGFDIGIITGISTNGERLPSEFEGITEYNADGGYDTIQFSGQVYPLSMKKVDRYPATVLATVCYGYKTTASDNVCIDPNPFASTTERKVCTPGPVSFGTQGAPIAVTTVEVDPTPRITRFKIHISNVGGGTVFKYGGDYLAKCNPYHTRGLEFNEIDVVRLTGVSVAGKTITPSCKPMDNEGNVRLINGQATVFCELGNLGTGPAYTTPLTVEVDYGYMSTVSKQIEIVQTP